MVTGRALDLDLNVHGAPNFRAPRQGDFNVFGAAQPRTQGLKAILSVLRCRPGTPNPSHVVWFSTREEPIGTSFIFAKWIAWSQVNMSIKNIQLAVMMRFLFNARLMLLLYIVDLVDFEHILFLFSIHLRPSICPARRFWTKTYATSFRPRRKPRSHRKSIKKWYTARSNPVCPDSFGTSAGIYNDLLRYGGLVLTHNEMGELLSFGIYSYVLIRTLKLRIAVKVRYCRHGLQLTAEMSRRPGSFGNIWSHRVGMWMSVHLYSEDPLNVNSKRLTIVSSVKIISFRTLPCLIFSLESLYLQTGR